MTTIACKDGVMAADTLMKGEYIDQVEFTKIFRISNLSTVCVGVAGDAEAVELFASWAKNGCLDGSYPARLKDLDYEAIILSKNGSIKSFVKSSFSLNIGDVAAIGSGAKFAMGAMMAGASANEAVEIACKLDVYSAVPIDVIDTTKLDI